MNRIVRAMLIAVSILTLASTASAESREPMRSKITDNAGMFSEKGIEDAKKVLNEIWSKNRIHVMVETFKTPPEQYAEKANSTDQKVKGEAFHDWAKSRAKELHANIYILICQKPGRVQPMIGNETEKQFTVEERDKLVKVILAKIEQQPDEALVSGLEYVKESLPEHAKQNGGSGSGLHWIIWLIIIGLGVFLVIGLIRMMSGAGRPGGGGGFMTSLLGGLFGAMAGMWVYNTFFGGSAHASGFGGDGGGGDFGSPADTDYSGSGGDFGGGDFGGGDFGGGGDF